MRTSTGRKLTEIRTYSSWQSFIEFNGPSQQKRQERLLKSLVFIRGSRWVNPSARVFEVFLTVSQSANKRQGQV